MPETRRRRRWPLIVAGVVVVLLLPVGIVAVPILMHSNAGLSNQQDVAESWPTSVTATGDDGRTRELSVDSVLSDLSPGDRLIVTGTGYDGSRGIYVAICVIPDDPATKPGPCLGGVPQQTGAPAEVGAVEYAPSNWINDDWAWKLFGARSYDDRAAGAFTAYLEVGAPVAKGIDCTTQKCGLFTRNDHTAASDRVQDLYLPVGFARAP